MFWASPTVWSEPPSPPAGYPNPRKHLKTVSDSSLGDIMYTSLALGLGVVMTDLASALSKDEFADPSVVGDVSPPGVAPLCTWDTKRDWRYSNLNDDDDSGLAYQDVEIVYEFEQTRDIGLVEVGQSQDPEKYEMGFRYDYIRIEWWDGASYRPIGSPVNHTGSNRACKKDTFQASMDLPVITNFIKLVLVRYPDSIPTSPAMRRQAPGRVANIGFSQLKII